MIDRVVALTASSALLGIAGFNVGVSAHAQAVPAARIQGAQILPAGPVTPDTRAAEQGSPLDLAPNKAGTIQVTMVRWGLHPVPAGRKAELTVLGKERVAIDTATNRARLEQFDNVAPAAGKPAMAPSLFVSDGTAAYDLIGSLNQYVKSDVKPGSKTVLSRNGLTPAGLSAVMGWSDAHFVAAPNETLDGKSLLTFVRKYSVSYAGTTYQYTAKVWADPETRLPVRYELGDKKPDSPDSDVTIQRLDFTDWKLNQPLDAGLFVWTPPAGATAYVAPKPVQPLDLLAAGTMAPDFTAEKWGGGDLKLSDYRGKVVILDFWATWCGPCQHSMPHVQHVADSIKGQDVVVIGICVWDDKDAYAKWVPTNQSRYTFQFGFDPVGKAKDKPNIATGLFKVNGIPTTYIIDKDGKVADSIVGYLDGDKRIEESLARLGVKVPETTKVASAQ